MPVVTVVPGPATITVLFTPVVTVLAGPLSPGVKPETTPGVLVTDGGGAVGVASGGDTAGAGITLLEVLQFVIGEEAVAGALDIGGGAPDTGAGSGAGGKACGTAGDAIVVEFVGGDGVELTVGPLSIDTAGCSGGGGGAAGAMLAEDATALSLSVVAAGD